MNKPKRYPNAIANWPKDERPREKLLKNGEHTLTNSELLAILLRSGVKGQTALELARKILEKFKTFRNLSHTDISHWKEFKGIGTAKLAQLKAALEIGRRFREEEVKEKKLKVSSSHDVMEIFSPRLRDLKKEVFKILLLDAKNNVIDIAEITEGTVNQAHPEVREVFHKALQNFATSIICVHNHPSGDPSPSREDKDFTLSLHQAGVALQISLLDHIIIGDSCCYSFADKGDLP